MKKYFIYILFFSLILVNFASSHVSHYKKIKLLKYELFLNNKLIGTHIFHFRQKNNLFYVNSKGSFKVNKLGVVIMDFEIQTEEVYKNDKLISFKSNTNQNNKKKIAKVNSKNEKTFIVDGSSFKGETDKSALIGSWWNHEIIKISKQISPISGRVNSQKVKFLGKENIIINGTQFKALHFHFLSDDKKSDDKKKINIHVWYDSKTLLWIKSKYNKFGEWEYRLSEVR